MRLIDADALLAKIKNPYQYASVATWVKDAPTIEERKNGRWIWKTGDIYRCSECNVDSRVAEFMEEPIYNFCPYCGADMRGEKE